MLTFNIFVVNTILKISAFKYVFFVLRCGGVRRIDRPRPFDSPSGLAQGEPNEKNSPRAHLDIILGIQNDRTHQQIHDLVHRAFTFFVLDEIQIHLIGRKSIFSDIDHQSFIRFVERL